jgi:hypothetical protein
LFAPAIVGRVCGAVFAGIVLAGIILACAGCVVGRVLAMLPSGLATRSPGAATAGTATCDATNAAALTRLMTWRMMLKLPLAISFL